MSDERLLSERYTTDVLHLLADRHLTKERERLLTYRDEIAALEDEIKALCAHRDSLEAERDRLREENRRIMRVMARPSRLGPLQPGQGDDE